MKPHTRIAALTALAAGAASLASAQGKYVNFEEPQVKPIAIAQVTIAEVPKSFALVCNTPDNSVEIYEGAGSHALVARVPVGLAPVTVRWSQELQRFFTCNFIGDSVTSVKLKVLGGTIVPLVERTVHVGDEPTDIVVLPGATQARVALHSRSRTVLVNTSDLSSIGDPVVLRAPSPSSTRFDLAVKAPRTLAVVGQRFYALNTAGGQTGSDYDLDLYVEDNGTTYTVGGMGTTNSNFALDSSGRMFVIGGKAQIQRVGRDDVADAPLGFVESHLWVVDLSGTGAPQVVQDQVASGTTIWQSIDLNRDYSSAIEAPLPATQRVSQPTDVLFVHDTVSQTDFLVVAAFGSDKVLLLSPDANQVGGYARQVVPLSVFAPAQGYGAVGPRGLAHDPLTGLVWVANRLDQSLAIFSPATPTSVQRLALGQDPTPVAIRTGRPFLYSAFRTSGNEMVACASCHVDGRTDGLPWNLGHLTVYPDTLEPIPPALIDNVDNLNLGQNASPFPHDFETEKGVMVTQTLQGLVNSHIDDTSLQYVTTNAPYHWRGDKPRFQDFNEAFHNLQKMPDIGTGGTTMGLTLVEMDQYTAFVQTIHYPPNPEQPRERVLGGDLGSSPDDLNMGSGELYGLKLFHVQPSMAMKACVHCHTLPEGSSNTLFLHFDTDGGLMLGDATHPRENAALRGLFQREEAFIEDRITSPNANALANFKPTDPLNWTRVAQFGLTHDGESSQAGTRDQLSLNDFNAGFSLGGDLVTDVILPPARRRALNEFVRQFDWGVAPAIGWVLTVDANHLATSTASTAILDDLRFAVEEGNAGMAVYARINGNVRGYTYDVSGTTNIYRRVGGTNTLTEAQLLALVDPNDDVAPDFDVLIFEATPAGSERRIAHVSGNPAPLSGVQVVPVTLLPMAPNTEFVEVTKLTAFTEPNGGPNDFQSIKVTRMLEKAARKGSFGVSPTIDRHEPPRRFRVAGQAGDIRPGAKLMLGMSVGLPGSSTLAWLPLDLVPTVHRYGSQAIWESVEELDYQMTMAFVNGGPELDIVTKALEGDLTSILDAVAFNDFYAIVVNENSTCSPFTSCVTMPATQDLQIGDVR